MKDEVKLPLVAGLLLLTFGVGGCGTIESSASSTRSFWDALSGKPRQAALMMENAASADKRREGINTLSDRSWGRLPPYTVRYSQIAKSDPDFTVRATAIRALDRSRARGFSSLYIAALRDPSDMVRVQAARALSNMPDAAAVPDLLAIVADANQSRDLRVQAAEALRHYHNLEVARTLAGQLGGRDFGVAWQSRQSLLLMTSRDWGYNEAAWLRYLTGPDKPFG